LSVLQPVLIVFVVFIVSAN